jgi:hypothetical protein
VIPLGWKESSDGDVCRAGRWFQADGGVLWRGIVDLHPEVISTALRRWRKEVSKVGLESGSLSPWLARELTDRGLLVVWTRGVWWMRRRRRV